MGSRAKKHRLTPTQYEALKKEVLNRDGYRCRNVQCRRRNNLHLHHIIFRSQQGPDTSCNLCTVCNDCHDLIHDRSTEKKLIILAKDGKPESIPDANVGLRFVTKFKGDK